MKKTLYKKLNTVSDVLCQSLLVLAVLIVVANVLSVLLQIFNRYLLVKISDLSVSWTEELSRFSMIWLCYIVLPVCYREGSMAKLDIFYSKFGKTGKMILYIITRIIIISFIMVSTIFGNKVVAKRLRYRSSMIGIPGAFLYSAPIVGCLIVMFEVVVEVIGVLTGELEPFEAGKKRTVSLFSKKEECSE